LTQCDTITHLSHHKSSNSLDPQMTAKGTVEAPTCFYFKGAQRKAERIHLNCNYDHCSKT
jgi:hypothetical protein